MILPLLSCINNINQIKCAEVILIWLSHSLRSYLEVCQSVLQSHTVTFHFLSQCEDWPLVFLSFKEIVDYVRMWVDNLDTNCFRGQFHRHLWHTDHALFPDDEILPDSRTALNSASHFQWPLFDTHCQTERQCYGTKSGKQGLVYH